MSANKLFVTLSGPSGVGKGSLQRAIDKIHPTLLITRPVLYTSRDARPGEVDGKHYHFKPKGFIKDLQSDTNFAVERVRSDWQAIDLTEVESLLESNDLVFAEVFYTFGRVLKDRTAAQGLDLKSVFLLPLTPCAEPVQVVAEMCGKLARRATDNWDKITERAVSAPSEIAQANNFTHRLVNTAGEDDVAQWGDCGVCCGLNGTRTITSTNDLGDAARWLVNTFVDIVECNIPDMREGSCLAE